MHVHVLEGLEVVNRAVMVSFCEGCNHRVTAMIIKNGGIPMPLIGCEIIKERGLACRQPLVADMEVFEELKQRPVENQTNI